MGEDRVTSIQCPHCGRASHNPNDVRERYCGFCCCYHSQLTTETYMAQIGRFVIRRIERQLQELAAANNVRVAVERVGGGWTQIDVRWSVSGPPVGVQSFMTAATGRWGK